MKSVVKLILITLFIVTSVILTSCSNLSDNNTIIGKEQIENQNNNLNTEIIDLSFNFVPAVKLAEGQPKENWIRKKKIHFGNLPYQIESTTYLYIENASNEIESSEGAIHAFLEHDNLFYDLGVVGSYGIEDVYVDLDGRITNSIEKIIIIGGLGATYAEMKVIGYNGASKEWMNYLTMGTPQFVDLDGDGQEEIVGVSTGSLPSFVDIYKWNGDHFEKASITEATGNMYASLYVKDGKWIIESGKWIDGQEMKPQYYRYENEKLIELERK